MMHRNATAEGCIVLDANVSSKHDRIRHDDSVFHFAVMGYVSASHKVAIITNRRDPIVFFGSAIDGDGFSKNIAFTNHDLGWGALIRYVLRFGTNDTVWEEVIVATNRSVSGKSHTVF
jgi:hypothetical protein